MQEYELLSPSGDMETVKAAVRYGADAVYVGGPFMQLRAQSAGFTMETLAEAASYVHGFGKKLYVTVNSFAENDEIASLGDYAFELKNAGADAVIVSDLGAIDTISNAVKDLEIHVSTQANCMNYAAANVYYRMGARRVVLARELSIEEIRKLRKNIPSDMQIEAFVHGAMCMSYSGRCLISAYLTGRSGNRGECTQPCRWKYYLYEENRPGEYFPLEEEGGKTAILSSHDMKMAEHIDELKDAGVYSFKIEGRMKTAYYTATVTNAYRMAVDGEKDFDYLNRELEAITHRPYSTGFYYGNERDHTYNSGEYIQSCKFVGVVKDCSDGILTVEQRNNFKKGDVLEALIPGKKPVSFTVGDMINPAGETVQSAPHAQEILRMECPVELNEGDLLRRWTPSL